MKDQTLQQSKGYENSQLQWGITERVFDIKPENRSEDMDYWFWKNKITASTQLRGIRFRGIRTTQDVWDSVKWKMFEDTLQNWDIRYDNVDRKIKVYSTDYTDFSHIPEWWIDARSYMAWEYVLYNWKLYLALQDSDYTQQPWTPAWDGLRKLVLSYWSILPLDNTNAYFFAWVWPSSPVPPNVWIDAIWYQWYTSNDYYENLIWWQIKIPSTWYYLLNAREIRWPRAWFTWIASRISKLVWSTWFPISEDYKYWSTITVTWTDSISWPISATVDQWIIDISTTSNTWMWYLTKWDIIKVEVFHNRTWNTIDINDDRLQITRLF